MKVYRKSECCWPLSNLVHSIIYISIWFYSIEWTYTHESLSQSGSERFRNDLKYIYNFIIMMSSLVNSKTKELLLLLTLAKCSSKYLLHLNPLAALHLCLDHNYKVTTYFKITFRILLNTFKLRTFDLFWFILKSNCLHLNHHLIQHYLLLKINALNKTAELVQFYSDEY